MTKLAIIGGTGLTSIDELQIVSNETVDTPYGAPSASLVGLVNYQVKKLFF